MLKFLSPRSFKNTVAIRLSFIVLGVVLQACGKPESTQPAGSDEIVVSIGPLALITREIVGEDIPVRQLVQGGDPHHYAPKVTDRMAMEKAQLVIWMGPAMESVLARQMSLLPPARQLGLLAAGGYEFDGADQDDPHLWLRPRNAAVMAAHIASRLAQLNPAQADAYRERARDFSRAMANLQKVQDRALWAYRDTPIVSTHKAYAQFFGPAGVKVESLGGSASHQHGARAMLEKHGALPADNGDTEEGDAVRGCLFGEVPANDRDRQTAANLNLGYQALDPLGSTLPAGANFRQLMEQLLADARQCLGKVPDHSR
ncbi:metal ABC transporter substrate-binding protein [Microbulbifer pacificus]|uniref:High-affinity zinc uptake system protein ZnuA n=1 Tax=Microbulbifer pacificus TaxID=407164 RepID=A0AAU0MTW1_9GAMM|nr:metal ABC transporter substrate-binding protein [Microbulbifer pacificus]WOX03924.1 metal ABC transporter substrate-binding protein [Microbulbifer pacificus]